MTIGKAIKGTFAAQLHPLSDALSKLTVTGKVECEKGYTAKLAEVIPPGFNPTILWLYVEDVRSDSEAGSRDVQFEIETQHIIGKVDIRSASPTIEIKVTQN